MGRAGLGGEGLGPLPRRLREAEDPGAGTDPGQHQKEEAVTGAENFWLNTPTGAEQAEAVSSSPLFQDRIDFLPLL